MDPEEQGRLGGRADGDGAPSGAQLGQREAGRQLLEKEDKAEGEPDGFLPLFPARC